MNIRHQCLSRREFLRGALAAAAGLCASDGVRAGQQPLDPHRFTLFSDVHVWEHRDQGLHGVKPSEQFLKARPEVQALDPRPATLLIAGDCAFRQGQAADYAVLGELLEPIERSGMAVHRILGNHDHRETFWKAFPRERAAVVAAVPDKHIVVVESARANWFLLDSLDQTNHTQGRLGPAQLQWLGKALDARPDKPALIVAHHNIDFTAKITGLLDADALLSILAPRKQVKAYFHGHTHCWDYQPMQGIHVVTLPTLVWRFNQAQPSGWVDANLRPDGIRLKLCALDAAHPANGQVRDLKWR